MLDSRDVTGECHRVMSAQHHWRSLLAACLSFAWLQVACNGEGEAASECPASSGGVKTPSIVESTFERIDGVTQMRHPAVIDESGIFWFDQAGALYALSHEGNGTPEVLRSAPAEGFQVLGIVGDESALYWGEATTPPEPGPPEVGPPPPPGRLYSIPKGGGDSILLLEGSDHLLTPLAAVEGRVITLRSYREASLLSVAKDGSESERLAPNVPAEQARVIEGKLHWFVEGEDSSDTKGYYQDLWRANLDGSAPEHITRIEGYEFLASDGVILWREERELVDPLVLDQNYVMLDERSGCVTPLPSLGETISFDSVMDRSHVYWFSFNGLEGFSPGDEPGVMPLIRVDLASGALEQVETPGFEAVLGDNIVGQTADRLYVVVDNGELVAIDKPR